jgi:hypothetical protein
MKRPNTIKSSGGHECEYGRGIGLLYTITNISFSFAFYLLSFENKRESREVVRLIL